MGWGRYGSRMRRDEKCVENFSWKIGRLRRRLKDNIRMDLRKIGLGSVDWIHLAHDMDQWRAVVYTVMNLRVP
jgi:hypothetical protein